MSPLDVTTRIAVVPGAPGLLPRNASLRDPFAELRASCCETVRWLVADDPEDVLVLALDGRDVADHLLASVGRPVRVRYGDPLRLPSLAGRAVLVVADGSARRHEKGPAALDERAFEFDATLGAALRRGDLAALRDLDLGLAAELLAAGAPVLRALARRLHGVASAETSYEGDPFGVQYWVVRWLAC